MSMHWCVVYICIVWEGVYWYMKCAVVCDKCTCTVGCMVLGVVLDVCYGLQLIQTQGSDST